MRNAPMHSKILAVALGCATLLLAGTALSGEGVAVKIINDGTDDIVVTVYDMSSKPGRVVLTHAHINGFTSVPISVNPDDTGRASLSWTATRTDGISPKCGHAVAVVDNEGEVSVHADSSCRTLAWSPPDAST